MRLNARPNDACWPAYKCCYMAVNKAASNTLNHVLYDTFGAPEYKRKASRMENRQAWFVFTFVRHPWERMLSSYTHNIAQGKVTGPQKARGIVRTMTLRDYIEHICSMEDSHMDKHWVPQVYRLSDDEGNFIPDFVGKVEWLEIDYAKLQRALPYVAARLPFPSALPKKKRRRHYRTRLDMADVMSPNLRALVRKRYSADFERFGYEMPKRDPWLCVG